MKIIRDTEFSGLMMIPLFSQFNLHRCNIKGCKEKQTTICIQDDIIFALCEKHYQEFNGKDNVNLSLEFD
jgi:hypothetical protein